MADDSSGDQATADRPLTHASAGSSPSAGHAYTPTVRRTDGGVQAAGCSGKPAASGWSPESYAEVLRRRGGPQEMEPSELMDTLLNSPGGCHNSWWEKLPARWRWSPTRFMPHSFLPDNNPLTKTCTAFVSVSPIPPPPPPPPPPPTPFPSLLLDGDAWSSLGEGFFFAG